MQVKSGQSQTAQKRYRMATSQETFNKQGTCSLGFFSDNPTMTLNSISTMIIKLTQGDGNFLKQEIKSEIEKWTPK